MWVATDQQRFQGMRVIRSICDLAIVTVWSVVGVLYLFGLHDDRQFADTAFAWTLVWFVFCHPRFVLETAFAGMAAAALVTSRPHRSIRGR